MEGREGVNLISDVTVNDILGYCGGDAESDPSEKDARVARGGIERLGLIEGDYVEVCSAFSGVF